MEFVEDYTWNPEETVPQFMEKLGNLGYQSIEANRAAGAIVKMKKAGAKIFLSFTSNMVTSGLRGFFAQLVKLGLPNVLVTTAGAIEEDLMKAFGEKFPISSFHADDVALHEKGMNRVGNLLISNESYGKLEDYLIHFFGKLYEQKKVWKPHELLREIGLDLKDENSILYQAAKNDIPIFCPAPTDGSLGFHLAMFQQKHEDFMIDLIGDFRDLMYQTTYDDAKGLISLGGGVSKHISLLTCLIQGGIDYAVYVTTARPNSGSASGATTQEAKSWGKIKDDSDAATVHGDVTILFPLIMSKALSQLQAEGLLKDDENKGLL